MVALGIVIAIGWFVLGAVLTGLLARIADQQLENDDTFLGVTFWPVVLIILFIIGLHALGNAVSGGRL